MNKKNHVVLGGLVLVLLTCIIIISFGVGNMRAKIAINNFSKQVESMNFNDFTLTVYYVDPITLLTLYPLDVNTLIKTYGEQKIVVDGSILEEHVDLLKQIKNAKLKPVWHKMYTDARIYYIFEVAGKKVFDVVMWGSNDDIDVEALLVNGAAIKVEDVFFDVIMPFLPDDVVKDLEDYFSS